MSVNKGMVLQLLQDLLLALDVLKKRVESLMETLEFFDTSGNDHLAGIHFRLASLKSKGFHLKYLEKVVARLEKKYPKQP